MNMSAEDTDRVLMELLNSESMSDYVAGAVIVQIMAGENKKNADLPSTAA